MSEEIPGKKITLPQLEEMFDGISAKTPWDMKGPMLWGYFFTSSGTAALESIRDELAGAGYRFVDLYQSEGGDDDALMWWLHMEKEEIHTPGSLDERNDSLCLLATRLGADAYDGMDVGPVSA